MEKVESELLSRGFRQNRNNNWMKGSKVVQIAHYSEFQNGGIRVSWKKDWEDYLALVFDYSLGGGPICIVPAQAFFNSQFVTEKQKMPSFANSGYCWSQTFKLRDELPQLIISYKDRWDILETKTDDGFRIQKSVTPKQSVPQSTVTVSKTSISFMDEKQLADYLQRKIKDLPPSEQKIILEVWTNKSDYIKWPKVSILLIPGLVRPKNGFHKYSQDMIRKLAERGIKVDSRTNGPAIMSYLYARWRKTITQRQ